MRITIKRHKETVTLICEGKFPEIKASNYIAGNKYTPSSHLFNTELSVFGTINEGLCTGVVKFVAAKYAKKSFLKTKKAALDYQQDIRRLNNG